MEFKNKLVDVVQVFSGKVLKPGVLTAFRVNFEKYPFFEQICASEDVLKTDKSVFLTFLCLLSKANLTKMGIFIRLAHRLLRIGAIILIIRHRMYCCQFTPKVIKAVDSHSDQPLRSIDEIIANNISAIVRFRFIA